MSGPVPEEDPRPRDVVAEDHSESEHVKAMKRAGYRPVEGENYPDDDLDEMTTYERVEDEPGKDL